MFRTTVFALILTLSIVPWTQMVAAAPAHDEVLAIPANGGTYYIVVCRNLAAIPPVDPIQVQEGQLVTDCLNSGIYQESNHLAGAQIYAGLDGASAFGGDVPVLVV